MHDNDHPTVMLGERRAGPNPDCIFGWGPLSLPLLLILIKALKDENITMN